MVIMVIGMVIGRTLFEHTCTCIFLLVKSRIGCTLSSLVHVAVALIMMYDRKFCCHLSTSIGQFAMQQTLKIES